MSRKIRRGQLIQPYGVGGLVELEGESFVIKDITEWPSTGLVAVSLPGLQEILPSHVRRLEGHGEDASVSVARFPRWLFCPSCREMYQWRAIDEQQLGDRKPSCANTACEGKQLTPMRWVRVCDAGHLDDIDWYFMAHSRAQAVDQGSCDRRKARLRFKTSGGAGGDFDSMRVECECGASRSLNFISQKTLPGRCCGKQPWQAISEAESCELQMLAEPRGSSALHYPKVVSALAIPQELDDHPGIGRLLDNLREKLQVFSQIFADRETLERDPTALAQLEQLIGQSAEDYNVPIAEAREAVLHHMYPPAEATSVYTSWQDATVQDRVRAAELAILCSDSSVDQADFAATHEILEPASALGRYFRKVTRVRRVREVRVMEGFYRLDISENNRLVRPDLASRAGWLNAVEVSGEGVFLEFNENALGEWEDSNRSKLTKWVEPLAQAATRSGFANRLGLVKTPRFVMAHTFAHLLLRQMSFDSGYGSNALRERVYCEEGAEAAGVLIYTADSDSEGSMGGLVELAEINRLERIIKGAIRSSDWCSSDPVCRETVQQGLDGLNRSACHACCLVAETSCEYMNVFLDRVLVSGGEGLVKGVDEPTGFFAPLLDEGGA